MKVLLFFCVFLGSIIDANACVGSFFDLDYIVNAKTVVIGKISGMQYLSIDRINRKRSYKIIKDNCAMVIKIKGDGNYVFISHLPLDYFEKNNKIQTSHGYFLKINGDLNLLGNNFELNLKRKQPLAVDEKLYRLCENKNDCRRISACGITKSTNFHFLESMKLLIKNDSFKCMEEFNIRSNADCINNLCEK